MGTRSKIGAALLVALVALTLGACGSSSHTAGAGSTTSPGAQTANSSGNGAYLGKASNAVVFVQWTARSGRQLTGMLSQAIERSPSGSEASVEPDHTGFTGTINGSSLMLAMSGGTNLTGTLSGGHLALDYPGNGGGITTIQMSPATSAEYNEALEALKGQTGQANTASQATTVGRALATDIEKVDTESNTAGVDASSDLSELAATSRRLCRRSRRCWVRRRTRRCSRVSAAPTPAKWAPTPALSGPTWANLKPTRGATASAASNRLLPRCSRTRARSLSCARATRRSCPLRRRQ